MTLSNKIFRNFDICLKGEYKYISIEDKWNLFNIYISNPFKTYWKARKLFKRPKTKVRFFWKNALNYSPYVWGGTIGRFLDIYIGDICWKDKWNSPRHERNPIIYISLFKRFGFVIYPEVTTVDEFGQKKNADMDYWEYLLWYVYYNSNLSYNRQGFWVMTSEIAQETIYNEDGTKTTRPYKMPIMPHLFSLNKKGLETFKRIYEQAKNSRNSKKSSEQPKILQRTI